MKAKHSDRAINALYVARRKAAAMSDESGFKGILGWAHLERIEDKLRAIDPDGDWRYEGRDFPGNWEVKR